MCLKDSDGMEIVKILKKCRFLSDCSFSLICTGCADLFVLTISTCTVTPSGLTASRAQAFLGFIKTVHVICIPSGLFHFVLSFFLLITY